MVVGLLEVLEKFAVVVVGCWIIESLCLPTEVIRDLYVTFTLLVKVKVRLSKVTIKETGISRETGCDNMFFMSGTFKYIKFPWNFE